MNLSNTSKFLPVLKAKNHVLIILLFWALGLKLFHFIGLAEGDDLYYTALANRVANGHFEAHFIFDVRWLVFYPTALLYKLFGANDITSLLMPILASMLSIFFAFRIVENALDRNHAIVATLIYSSVPVVLIYANVLQVAAFLECCTLGSILFLQRALKTDKWQDYALCGLLIGLVTMTRITGLFIAPIVAVFLIAMRGFKLRTLFMLSLIAAVSLIPLVIQGLVFWQVHGDFLHRIAQSQSVIKFQANLEGIDPKDLFFYIRTLFLKEDFANWTYFGLLGYLGIPAMLVAFWYSLASRQKAAGFFALWFLAYFCLMSFTPTSVEPYTTLIRNIRYAIVFVLPLSACLAWAILQLPTDKLSNKMSFIAKSFLVISIVITHLVLTSHNIEPFHKRQQIQKSASTRILSEIGDHKVYLADRNIDRRLLYYSGYQFKNFRRVKAISQIRGPGYFLMLKMGYNKQRYRIPKRQQAKIRRNPSRYGMKYLGDYGYFWVYQVGELEPSNNESIPLPFRKKF
jgi:4-amino-4-deoxy-L-arabinose transferase-like glycosyltransferase